MNEVGDGFVCTGPACAWCWRPVRQELARALPNERLFLKPYDLNEVETHIHDLLDWARGN